MNLPLLPKKRRKAEDSSGQKKDKDNPAIAGLPTGNIELAAQFNSNTLRLSHSPYHKREGFKPLLGFLAGN